MNACTHTCISNMRAHAHGDNNNVTHINCMRNVGVQEEGVHQYCDGDVDAQNLKSNGCEVRRTFSWGNMRLDEILKEAVYCSEGRHVCVCVCVCVCLYMYVCVFVCVQRPIYTPYEP